MKKTVNIIIFALLLVIFGSYMFTFQVRQDEIAFVDTFGEISEPIESAGLKYKWPWPIQDVYKFDKRVHLKTTAYSQIKTGDGSMIVQVYFGWKIKDPAQFMEKAKGSTANDRRQDAEKKLEKEIEGAVSVVFGAETNITESVEVSLKTLIDGESGNPTATGRKDTFDKLEQKIKKQASAKAEAYGMELTFVGIRRVGIADDGLKVTLQAMVTQWTNAAGKDIFKAQEEARHIRETAENNKNSALEKARADAAQITAEASAKVTELFREMEEKDAELAAFLMELATMEATLKKETTLVLDEDFPFLGPLRGKFLKLNEKGEVPGAEEDAGSEPGAAEEPEEKTETTFNP